jgi:hypothetical protein
MKRSPREPVVPVERLNWAYRQPLRATRKTILAYLVRRANKDARCWPGQRTIAKDTGTSTRTVIRSLRMLRLCGLVNVVRQEKRAGGRHGIQNTYVLNFNVDVTAEAARQAEWITRPRDQSDRKSPRSGATKVTMGPDQSDRSITEDIQEDFTTCSELTKYGVRAVWRGGQKFSAKEFPSCPLDIGREAANG